MTINDFKVTMTTSYAGWSPYILFKECRKLGCGRGPLFFILGISRHESLYLGPGQIIIFYREKPRDECNPMNNSVAPDEQLHGLGVVPINHHMTQKKQCCNLV